MNITSIDYRPELPTARRSAFTLVELLVVISIIALLIALLLPALGRAKEASWRIKCLGGAQQLNLAVKYYTNDYKGTFIVGTMPPDLSTGAMKILITKDYVGQDVFTNKTCPYGPKAPYLVNQGNASGDEPSDPKSSYEINSKLQYGYGYSYWGDPGSASHKGPFREDEGRLRKWPTDVAIIICSHHPGSWTVDEVQHLDRALRGWTSVGSPVRSRHNREGLNFVFHDGHGEFLPATAFAPNIDSATSWWTWHANPTIYRRMLRSFSRKHTVAGVDS